MNFLPVKTYNPFYKKYAYVDLSENIADRLFVELGIKNIKFLGDYKNNDFPYIITICRIKKKDDAKFKQAMSKLYDTMRILGHTEYDEVSQGLMDMIKKES